MRNIYGVYTKVNIEGNILKIEVDCDYIENELEFAFYIYIDDRIIYEGKYSSERNLELKIDSAGNYKIRTFVKQKDEHYKNAYSLYSEFDYGIEVIIDSLLTELHNQNKKRRLFFSSKMSKESAVDKTHFEQKISLVLSYIHNLQKLSLEFGDASFMLTSILSLGGNIFEYLQDKGHKSVSIYSDTFFGVCLYIAARFSGVGTKLLMGSGPQKYTVNVPSANTIISFLHYSAAEQLDDSDVIIVTDKYSESINKSLASVTNAHITYWNNLAIECFTHNLIVEPFKLIQSKNPGVRIMICNNPGASFVKNASEHEKNINTFLPSIEQYMDYGNLTDPVFGINGLDLEYVREVTGGFSLYYDKNNITHFKDRQGKYVNIVGGQRVTTDLPDEYKGTIYIFGSSLCLGTGTDDSNTVASCLQRLLNKNGILYAVQNCSNYSASDDDRQIALINSMQFNPNDIIISMLRTKERIDSIKNIFPYCDVIPAFDRPHEMGEVFIDQSHINFVGNQRMAETLYNFIEEHNFFEYDGNRNANIRNRDLQDNYDLTDNEKSELDSYIEGLRSAAISNKTRIGAVVVNCNPFTLGHRYLIETAASEVTHLYVFVVEEDKSMFPFKDRILLVKKGLEDIKNVTVFPSGKFIISTRTFAAYSNKDNLQNNTIDASTDVRIFAETISPSLGITIRFVGEEPLCNVTRQYNHAMKTILPQYNIDFKVIPRKRSGDAPISASRVRTLLMKGDFEEIENIVPPTTLEYLRNYYYKNS